MTCFIYFYVLPLTTKYYRVIDIADTKSIEGAAAGVCFFGLFVEIKAEVADILALFHQFI